MSQQLFYSHSRPFFFFPFTAGLDLADFVSLSVLSFSPHYVASSICHRRFHHSTGRRGRSRRREGRREERKEGRREEREKKKAANTPQLSPTCTSRVAVGSVHNTADKRFKSAALAAARSNLHDSRSLCLHDCRLLLS